MKSLSFSLSVDSLLNHDLEMRVEQACLSRFEAPLDGVSADRYHCRVAADHMDLVLSQQEPDVLDIRVERFRCLCDRNSNYNLLAGGTENT